MTDKYTPLLTVKGLTRYFGNARIVDDVTLSIARGRIRVIIGPNGAGKTTLINLIAGTIPKSKNAALKGNVMYYGSEQPVDITGYPAYRIARLGIGRTFQDNRVFGNMTLLENVMTAENLYCIENPAAVVKNTRPGLAQRIASPDAFEKHRGNVTGIVQEKAEYWLNYTGLFEKRYEKAKHISYGQQKLLSIARLLMAECKLFLFDEPTAGVNPKLSRQIGEIFEAITESGDRSILFIEHDMRFIKDLACKCLYMEDGKCPWPFYELDVIMKNEDILKKFMGM